MRYYASVDTNGLSLTLAFRADTMAIINTTQYTLAVRVGAQERPANIAAATIYFPPGTMVSVPVEGTDFGMSLVTPTLTAAQPGMPTAAQVIFMQGELPPTFASSPITSIYGNLATEVIIQNVANDGTSPRTINNVAVPSNIRALTIIPTNLANLTQVIVFGTQTNIRYLNYTEPSGSAIGIIRGAIKIPWYGSLDSSYSITVQCSSNNSFIVVGHTTVDERGMFHNDGPQRVYSDLYFEGAIVSPNNALPVVLPTVANPRTSYLPQAFRTAATAGGSIATGGKNGATIIVNVTGNPGAQTLGVSVYFPNANLPYYSSAANISGNGEWVYQIGPGLSGAVSGNVRERVALPFLDGSAVFISPSGAGTWQYSVDYILHQ